MGIVFSPLGIGLSVGAVLTTLISWHARHEGDDRSFDDYIGDIRAMNANNAYYVGAIVIFLGFAVEGEDVPQSALVQLLFAFVCGSMALFFFPMRKTGGPGRRSIERYWLFKVLMSQLTVVLSLTGVGNVIAQILKN